MAAIFPSRRERRASRRETASPTPTSTPSCPRWPPSAPPAFPSRPWRRSWFSIPPMSERPEADAGCGAARTLRAAIATGAAKAASSMTAACSTPRASIRHGRGWPAPMRHDPRADGDGAGDRRGVATASSCTARASWPAMPATCPAIPRGRESTSPAAGRSLSSRTFPNCAPATTPRPFSPAR